MIRKFVLATSLLVIASVSYAEERLGILQVEAPVIEIFLEVFGEDGGHISSKNLPVPVNEGVRFEAVIDLNADGTRQEYPWGDIFYSYPKPAARSAKLVLPVGPGVIELGEGDIQTQEKDETNPYQGPWIKDQINVRHQLPEGERFTIKIDGEEDFRVMAIDVQTFNYASSDPILLETPELAKKESGQFQFSAGRVEVRVFFIEFGESGSFRQFNVVGQKDLESLDTDQDGVLDAIDSCESTVSGSVVDASGCSVQQYCPCEADWKNHGQMVACTSSVAEIFVSEGLLTNDEKDGVVGEAARSSCGKPAKGKK